jgi:hypothetical protein
MPIPVHDALVRSMSSTELSRVRTECRLTLPEPINHATSVLPSNDATRHSSAPLRAQTVSLVS